MRRRSFLSSYKFLVIVLCTLNILAEQNGIVKGECTLSPKGQAKLTRIVGYYTPDNNSRTPSYTSYTGDSTILTHLNYVVSDPNDLLQSFSDSNLLDIKNSKSKIKCKILLSVSLSKIDPITPWDSSFANTLAGHVNNYTLDGVDIEYPILRCDSLHNDSAAFTIFIGLVRNALNSSKILTVTYGPQLLSKFDPNIVNNVDFINVMAYQLNSYTSTVILSSPLNRGGQSYGYDNYFTYLGIIGSDKVVIGVDFGGILEMLYLRNANDNFESEYKDVSFTRANLNVMPPNGTKPFLGETCQNQDAFSWSLRDMTIFGIFSSPNICEGTNNWKRVFDNITQVPYLYKFYDNITSGNGASRQTFPRYQFISYEDPESLSLKINWIMSNKYGGLAIANLTGDTDSAMWNVIRSIMSGQTPSSSPTPNPTSGSGPPINSTTPSDLSASSHSKDLSAGAISGIVIVVVLSFVALSAFMIIFVRRRRQNNEKGANWPNRPVAPNTTMLTTTQSTFVTALYDFEGKEESDLSFKKGDRIEVIERGNGPIDWWVGKVNGVVGEFPGNYVVADS